MANLIRLKQIESGSALQTSAEIGSDFSQSVVNIVTQNVEAVLPDGVVSSSAQITLADTIGQITSSRLIGDIVATSVNYEDIVGLPTLLSGSEQIINLGFQTTASFNEYTSSLGDTFATDLELYQTSSQIIDQGEW